MVNKRYDHLWEVLEYFATADAIQQNADDDATPAKHSMENAQENRTGISVWQNEYNEYQAKLAVCEDATRTSRDARQHWDAVWAAAIKDLSITDIRALDADVSARYNDAFRRTRRYR